MAGGALHSISKDPDSSSKNLTQTALNISLLEDKTPQVLSVPTRDAGECSAQYRTQGCRELGITRSQLTKIAELQLLGQGWLGPQHPGRQD